MVAKTGFCQIRVHPKNWLPIETEWHHILPKAMGGLDTWANKVEVCALCHDNIHALMWRIANNKPVPNGYVNEKKYANRALKEWSGTGVVPRGAGVYSGPVSGSNSNGAFTGSDG